MRLRVLVSLVLLLSSVAALASGRQPADTGTTSGLAGALTFHAAFDGTTDARVARGDRTLYSATSRKEAGSATPVATGDAVQIARGQGRQGDALQLKVGASPFVFYRGDRNITWRPRDWSGTVSVWMQLDPDADLAPGYSDPLIITPRAWNDAALFIDFTRDDVPRRFRFAAFADREVWDPARREWDAVPVDERPMVEVTGRRFGRGRWTHVAWTWSRFNTGKPDGVFTCYLDGEQVGVLGDRRQTFTWDPREASIALGVQYIGLMDDLAIFDRALTGDEIRTLRDLPAGASSLAPAR